MKKRNRLQLAGLALDNGVLIIGPNSWACAVRGRDGKITVADGSRGGIPAALGRVPLARGLVGVGQMLALIPAVKRALPQARFPLERPQSLATIAAAAVGSRYLRQTLRNPGSRELGIAALNLAALMASLRGGRTRAFHGAEHKAIAGYELGIPAAAADREHPRCGTGLLVPSMLASAVATVVARRTRLGGEAANAVGSLVGMAAATEVVRRAVGNHNHPVDRAVRRVGWLIQNRMTTREPDAAELAVAEKALSTVLRREKARH